MNKYDEENDVSMLEDAEAIQSLFTDQLMLDARETFREMQSPAVLRIRAEMEDPVTYRILSMRLANMGSARESLRTRVLKLLDEEIPLENEGQRKALYRDVQRALDSCSRVLESTDKENFVSLVVENSEAMSHFIGKMSALLSVRFPAFAQKLAAASMQATEMAETAPQIAANMKAAYEVFRIEIDSAGPRAPVPVSELKKDPTDDEQESVAPR